MIGLYKKKACDKVSKTYQCIEVLPSAPLVNDRNSALNTYFDLVLDHLDPPRDVHFAAASPQHQSVVLRDHNLSNLNQI